MVRQPAVANQFYEGDPTRLRRQLATLMGKGAKETTAKAIIAPHAGYMYSGHVAGAAYAKVKVPETVIVMGPNHTGFGAPAAVMASGKWAMPLGIVPIAEELALDLVDSSRYLENDVQAHLYEHSLEVQVPFLQYKQPDLRIVPICLSSMPFEACEEIGMAVARVVNRHGGPVLMVASTDMTHYEPQAQAEAKDQLAIERILEMDAQGLFNTVRANGISMCGVIPTTIAMVASNALGPSVARLIRYATSGDVSGDYQRVVGYASFIIQ